MIEVLNPILRGWANYYKHGVSSEVFGTFDHHMVHLLLRWAKKRHPTKGPRWIVPHYFTRVGGDNWVFYAKTADRRGDPTVDYLYKVARTTITRHVKVAGTASPDDPALTDYWATRSTKYGKTYFAKGSKLYLVANSQGWRCPVCREHLFNGQRIHIHHVKMVTDHGTDEQENLCILHEVCHQVVHGRPTNVESLEA